MRIGGKAWYLWIRKHFPFLRPRSKVKKGQWIDYDGPCLVVDNRIDHCGDILLRDMEGQEVWVSAWKVEQVTEEGT